MAQGTRTAGQVTPQPSSVTAPRHVLAIDLGTSGCKVAVVRLDGHVESFAFEPVATHFVGELGVEQDPEDWWRSLVAATGRALAASPVAAERIEALACSCQGEGTVATWKLQATESRIRDVKAEVDVAGHSVIEKDANSSMVTTWTVAPAGTGSTITTKTSWTGAGGVKGFFEKTFAPLGLRKIQAEVLENLKKQVEGA